MTDPEVRGWIYLSDVTEIAEHRDTIILTSVARTLHLYAQTRAEHSLWVAGLAKLCPDAFTMLGRERCVLMSGDNGSAGTSTAVPCTYVYFQCSRRIRMTSQNVLICL